MDWPTLGVDRVVGLHLIWTAGFIGGAYLLGHVANVVVIGRLVRLASRTKGAWDDILIGELKRRIPFWSLLAGASLALGQWDLSPHALTFATGAIKALAIASLTFALSAVISQLITSYGQSGTPGVPVSALTRNVSRFVVIVLGLLVIVRGFGFDITPYLAALGVGGLAVALALQDPLSNLFGGVFMSLSGQVRIGDYVRVDPNVEGYIVDFDWRTTRVRALANNIVMVPNAKLAQAIVVNYSQPTPEVAVSLDVAVDPTSDLAVVERVAMEVAREVMRDVPGAVPDAETPVRFSALSGAAVTFAVGMRGRTFADQALIKHEFIKRLHARFVSERIALALPAQALTTRTPLQVAVRPEKGA